MTENMAGRGEGLAGLVAKWRKFVRCVMENEVVAPVGDDFAYCDAMRHCANELEAEIDAAAPAGTPEQLHEVWASKILKEYGIYAIPQALADFQAALATPSPQAPQIEIHNESTAGAVKPEPVIYAQEPAGSGALREALGELLDKFERHATYRLISQDETELTGNFRWLPTEKLFIEDVRYQEMLALLSLSSPIEPPPADASFITQAILTGLASMADMANQKLQAIVSRAGLCADEPNKEDAELVEKYSLELAEEMRNYVQAARRANEVARPPQASSEIRAKMMASFDKVIPSFEMRVQIVSCILRALKS